MVWIIIGVLALGAGVWAFWPRRRGVIDGELRRRQQTDQGSVEQYRRPTMPQDFGPGSF